jgi:hypothetical protein
MTFGSSADAIAGSEPVRREPLGRTYDSASSGVRHLEAASVVLEATPSGASSGGGNVALPDVCN